MKRRTGIAPGQGKTESTRAGEQHVFPGAEKVSDGKLTKRRARSPLKPKVGQKPANEGLFGDGAKQTDLVDLARQAKAYQTSNWLDGLSARREPLLVVHSLLR
jgi:hypothetical protein